MVEAEQRPALGWGQGRGSGDVLLGGQHHAKPCADAWRCGCTARG